MLYKFKFYSIWAKPRKQEYKSRSLISKTQNDSLKHNSRLTKHNHKTKTLAGSLYISDFREKKITLQTFKLKSR